MTEGLFGYNFLFLTIPPSCSASHLPLHKGGFGKPSLKKHHQRNFLGGVSYFSAKKCIADGSAFCSFLTPFDSSLHILSNRESPKTAFHINYRKVRLCTETTETPADRCRTPRFGNARFANAECMQSGKTAVAAWRVTSARERKRTPAPRPNPLVPSATATIAPPALPFAKTARIISAGAWKAILLRAFTRRYRRS